MPCRYGGLVGSAWARGGQRHARRKVVGTGEAWMPCSPGGRRTRVRSIHAEMRRMATTSFQWRDGERTIHFGRDALERALPLFGIGYVLLTTSRALARAPKLADRASVVHSIPAGRVDELAG